VYQIESKQVLAQSVTKYWIKAPFIANKALPGQFVVVRVDETGERAPFTVHDVDKEKGLVCLVVQEVGKTTRKMSLMKAGDSFIDVSGPLGRPTHLDGIGRAVIVGGGLGCAIAYPQARALTDMGSRVDLIGGFRNKELIILEDEMNAASENFYICTDDGSYGEPGFVTEKLKKLLEAGEEYDMCLAIGPLVMMRAVSEVTRPFGLKTVVSMNSIMVDATGMCGCCRLTVGGQTRFACVDGPEFDGHEIDYNEALARSRIYFDYEREQDCRLLEQIEKEAASDA